MKSLNFHTKLIYYLSMPYWHLHVIPRSVDVTKNYKIIVQHIFFYLKTLICYGEKFKFPFLNTFFSQSLNISQ